MADTLIDFILGSSANPTEIAVRFLLFVIFLDSIFSTVNTLLKGVRAT